MQRQEPLSAALEAPQASQQARQTAATTPLHLFLAMSAKPVSVAAPMKRHAREKAKEEQKASKALDGPQRLDNKGEQE